MTSKEETAVAAIEKPTNMLQIIASAVADPRCDIEKMERLFALQERFMEQERKTAFMGAMARLQADLPQINKYGQGKNSKFAKLEDVDVVIRPLLAREGFSFSFDEESHDATTVTFVAWLAHAGGHRESKRLTVPVDVAAKNREGNSVRPAIQDAGSTVSYARRYLIKMMLNIIETNEDTDGERRTPISAEQVGDLKAALEQVGMNVPKFLVFMGVGDLKEISAKDWKKALNAIEVKRASK